MRGEQVHFEILVEDQSGKKVLDILVPKIVGVGHTFIVHPYKGIGRIPPRMRNPRDAAHRMLLDNLPRVLRGYGKTFAGRKNYREAVIIVCDLDDRCLKRLRTELGEILNHCDPRPLTRFCVAIEEGEAWLLGDLAAIKAAYPGARSTVLESYTNDSICGTWERLADAIHSGGALALASKGWHAVGVEKSKWAEEIATLMVVDRNLSPSFQYFRAKIRELADMQ